MNLPLSLLAVALTLLPACAFAENWTVYHDDQRHGLVLSGMPDEEETDLDLWLLCRKDGRFDIGAGANNNIGKGNGEKVSLTISGSGKIAVLHGVSKESLNAPMTGGTELVTTINGDNALFAILATGKPFKIGGTTVGVEGLRKSLGKFRTGCPAKK